MLKGFKTIAIKDETNKIYILELDVIIYNLFNSILFLLLNSIDVLQLQE